MPFSRLLLIAANSKKYIHGQKKDKDKIIITPRMGNTYGNDPFAGEIILCFQIDDKEKGVPQCLGINQNKHCDGLIFYAQDESDKITLCLVEMKSNDISQTAKQIIATREHIKNLLCKDGCEEYLNKIRWKACFYHRSCAKNDISMALKTLKEAEFEDVTRCDHTNNDLGPFLRGEKYTVKKPGMFRRGKRG